MIDIREEIIDDMELSTNAIAQEPQPKNLESDLKKTKIQYYKDRNYLRITYAPKVYRMMVAWLYFDGFIILSYIIAQWFGKSILPASVLIALITSTTISILGLFAIILGNIFPKNNS